MSSKKKPRETSEIRFASEMTRILGEFDHKNFPKIAVALSGGCDSLAMTFLMRNFCAQRNIELTALTVNHQMRNNSSAQIFDLGQLLSKHQIAYKVLTIEENLLPKRNIEAKLRELRYELLISFCQKNDIKLLLFAHHLNDTAENFLIRLFRGSGLDGLSTMREKQEISGILAVRPLLNFTKNDLQNFLRSLELEWFEDETNADEKFLRNKIRRLLAEFPEQNLIATRIKKACDHISQTRDLFDNLVNHWQGKILVEISPKLNDHQNSISHKAETLNQVASSPVKAQELVEPKTRRCEISETKEAAKSLGTAEKLGFFEEFLGSQICEKASLHRRRCSRANLDNDKIVEKDGFAAVPLFLNRFELASCPKEIALKILALALMKVSGKPYKPRLEKLQNFYDHIKFCETSKTLNEAFVNQLSCKSKPLNRTDSLNQKMAKSKDLRQGPKVRTFYGCIAKSINSEIIQLSPEILKKK